MVDRLAADSVIYEINETCQNVGLMLHMLIFLLLIVENCNTQYSASSVAPNKLKTHSVTLTTFVVNLRPVVLLL